MSPLEKLSPDHLAEAAARGVTRRRAFRNAGGVALGAAMTTAYLGTRSDVVAQCSYSSVCGPAPLCGASRCNGYLCVPSSNTRWAHWEGGATYCSGNAGVDNCWDACSGGTRYLCCDCCAHNPTCTTGASCSASSCGSGGWRKCICRAASGSC